jgi:hypothetical protein
MYSFGLRKGCGIGKSFSAIDPVCIAGSGFYALHGFLPVTVFLFIHWHFPVLPVKYQVHPVGLRRPDTK